ncbi:MULTISPECIES: NlpC/P60 family protein [Nonomuraea]|jgi:cell wall-associated NlpC family hydrolase|uniref:NlpC/P60 family protein n=1 Tax=Nonomuraea salmonea TaxID=46181 RepID=A0ABV5P1Q8_9ACTN
MDVARGTAYVAVSVATVWTGSSSPRPQDAPGLGNPVDVPGWLAATSADREGLMSGGLTQTQALYGDEVEIVGGKDGWCEVAVPGQASRKDDRGYPGWIPAAQLVTGPAFGELRATVPFAQVDRARTTVLYQDPRLASALLRISAGTRLPVLAEDGPAVQVATPCGASGWLPAAAVTVRRSVDDIPRPSGVDLVATAALFLGLPYLWAGRSGLAVDCSGLTSLVHHIHGLPLPRDADDQHLHPAGRDVDATAGLEPGDLLFYTDDRDGASRAIDHVSMYAGDRRMIEARNGRHARVTEVRTEFLAGGRRFAVS